MKQPDDLDHRLEALRESEKATSPSPPVQEELLALERLIRRRVRRICLKTLSAVVICAILIFGLIHPLAKWTTFNPISMEEDGQAFTNYLNAYFGTMQPYVRVTGTSIEDTGFGTYDVSVYVVGTENLKVYIGGYTDVHLSVRQGKAEVTSDPTGKLTKYLGRFDSDLMASGELLSELEKLPDSAYIRLSVGTHTPLTLDQLWELPAEVVWAQIYDPNVEYQGGSIWPSRSSSVGNSIPGTWTVALWFSTMLTHWSSSSPSPRCSPPWASSAATESTTRQMWWKRP